MDKQGSLPLRIYRLYRLYVLWTYICITVANYRCEHRKSVHRYGPHIHLGREADSSSLDPATSIPTTLFFYLRLVRNTGYSFIGKTRCMGSVKGWWTIFSIIITLRNLRVSDKLENGIIPAGLIYRSKVSRQRRKSHYDRAAFPYALVGLFIRNIKRAPETI